MQKQIENIEFVQGLNFVPMDLLKNKGTKYLLISGNSGEKFCISKTFVVAATAGRHLALSIFYFRHILFRRSRPGPEVDLQSTHVALFKFPRDLMQVSTPSVQLELGSKPVDW